MTAAILRSQCLILKTSKRVSSRARSSATKLKSVITQIIMMGASINIGSVIGEGTMIDMNVVLGGRATVGKNCHIGAGSVLAGVIEPPSAKPVVIEDDVVIGANAVVLEGVTVGKGAVVAAGAIVVNDVEPYTVVAGTPAKKIKDIDEKTKGKTEIKQELRQL
ncbi:DapH/DapD/GlmU-related protein [Bacillus subtilis]